MKPRALPLSVALGAMLLCSACSGGDKEARRRATGPAPTRAALAAVASASAGAVVFRQCAACHSIGQGVPDRNGPNLFGVMGKPVTQNSQRFGYTAALQNLGGTWTPEKMDAWLANPRKLVPGTTMTFPGLADPLDRADTIAFLATQR